MTPFQPLFAHQGDRFMPFPLNSPKPDDLLSLSTAEIAALPVELKAILQCEIDERQKQIKSIKTRFDAAMVHCYATRASEMRQAVGKDTGSVRFDDGDFTIIADLPKRVDWDQDRLAKMVERISASDEDPTEYVDVVIRVPERKYAAWPQAIRDAFEPAREVRPGTLKIEIVPQGDDQ
jgi:hypothetical protein